MKNRIGNLLFCRSSNLGEIWIGLVVSESGKILWVKRGDRSESRFDQMERCLWADIKVATILGDTFCKNTWTYELIENGDNHAMP